MSFARVAAGTYFATLSVIASRPSSWSSNAALQVNSLVTDPMPIRVSAVTGSRVSSERRP